MRGTVADAHDLEVLAEPLRDAVDHVGEQRAGQAVQRACVRDVVGTRHDE